jgi:CheY-like chemotaxis protein
LYTLDGTGRGQAGMLNQAGCCNSPDNPAVRGTISSLYATGAGQTTPRGETGRVSAYDSVLKYPRPVLRVRVLVGGVPAKIEYVGNAPHAVAGLLQVNFRVPNNAPLGDAVPVVLVVGEAHSSEAATMAVRSARRQILLIEPSEATRTRLHRALTSVGFDVYAAEDNAAAEKIVTKTAIDLVIASMPSALAVVPNLQAKHTKLKILGTARALDAETLRSADLVGVQAVVSGTIRSNEVIRRARELLRPHLLPYELPRIPAVPVAR